MRLTGAAQGATSDYWAPAFGRRPSGLVRVVTREGIDTYGAWARLPQTGWTLLLAVPAGPWEHALLGGMATHLAFVAVLVGGGAALAWWLGRVMLRGAEGLSRSARQMVVDRKVEASPLAISEFETIRLGLVHAAQLLQRQDERGRRLERSRSELLASEQAARHEAEEANRFAGHRGAHRRGLGIGLSVVKRVVERHQGRVWAESEGTGRGSTFVVELPLA